MAQSFRNMQLGKKITKYLLNFADEKIYSFLKKNVDIMPNRFLKFVSVFYTDARIRRLYWERMGVKFGNNTCANIEFNIISDSVDNINVEIGNNVSIARNCTLIVDSSPNNSTGMCENDYIKNNLIKNGFIKIEDDVWIGANVTVLPNITIRKGSVIGAGSVVVSDTEEFSVYAGCPARKIRNI